MKNVLFATTALVAASFVTNAQARDVELSLGGFYRVGVAAGQFEAGNGGVNNNIDKDFHIINDGEIHFRGNGTLDNGIEITARVELEVAGQNSQTGTFNDIDDDDAVSAGDTFTAGGNGDIIDEQWVSIESQLGTILIGGNDNAAYQMQVGVRGISTGMTAVDTTYSFIPANIADIYDNADSLGVHYYTPNIFGFEFGVSYQPHDTDTFSTISSTDDATNNEDILSFGATYENSFNEVDFVIGAGVVYSEQTGDKTVVPGTAEGDGHRLGWGVGTTIDYQNFGLGLYYGYQEDGDGVVGNDDERSQFAVSGLYNTGPWGFGIHFGYEDFDDNAADAGDYEQFVIGVGSTYELGDGVNLGAGLEYGDVDFTAVGNNANDNEGFGGHILLGINF